MKGNLALVPYDLAGLTISRCERTPILGTGRSENGNEIDAETRQRCAWIGNEMVPKWYPARNGTSARSGKNIHNLLI